ncbi:MAG TPA: S41 family peptidase [Planctomycetota bacterium]|nr:S41 family peptidase [Planctomycetota bacterium]
MRIQPLTFFFGVVGGAALTASVMLLLRGGEDSDTARYREVRDWVRANYVRDVEPSELLDSALHGMVESLDGYSRYFDNAQVASFERDTTGRYRGIGVVFRPPLEAGRVLFTLPGSPADIAGLRPGDAILAVDGRTRADLGPAEFQAAIADGSKDELALSVRGLDGAERALRLVRDDKLVDPTVRHAELIDAERGIAYLSITSFSQETPAEVDRAVSGLQALGMRALVIDLRANLGGVLHSAVRVANRFIEKGLIVSTEGRGEPKRYEAMRVEATLAELPLVLLVDADTASASEVLAGAVQDHRRAVLVGAPTYGKGMVQKVQPFGDDDSEVKLTTAYYYTPAHTNIERTVQRGREHGLIPDLRVDLNRESSVRVRAFLSHYSPPPGALEALRAWQAQEGIELIESHPPDAQLEAALGLFRGERPGPSALVKRS